MLIMLSAILRVDIPKVQKEPFIVQQPLFSSVFLLFKTYVTILIFLGIILYIEVQ